jgi:hypothetical protein
VPGPLRLLEELELMRLLSEELELELLWPLELELEDPELEGPELERLERLLLLLLSSRGRLRFVSALSLLEVELEALERLLLLLE